MTWQILDVRAIWIKEFAAALSKQTPALGWLPRFSPAGRLQTQEAEFMNVDPPLQMRSFPLQRGFARFPFDTLLNESSRIVKRLSERAGSAAHSPLVCTTPHYAAVAEKWPGPVVYYVTDFFPAYGNKPAYIATLDKLMCAAAALVCPNSRRIAEYLQDVAGCPAEKVLIVPNATRSSNVLPEPLVRPAALPDDIADLPRPIAGVIGNLAANTDWKLVCEVIRQTPWLSWVFVGPATTPIRENDQREARQSLLNLGGRVRFTGEKPYGQLSSYARACNVGVLPYRSIEPTFSGSSTRFYEHLAACQPMIATRGFAELLEKEPLLRLVDDAREMAATLEELSALSFHDGYEEMRWQASRQATWEQRATTMIATLSHRFEKGRVVAA